MSFLPAIFPASFDDLVFEGRNQTYGAYQLRQAYKGHVRQAMGLMLGLCALVFLGGTAWQRLHPVAVIPVGRSFPVTPMAPPTYVAEAPKPKPSAPPAAPSRPRPAAAAAPHAAASMATLVAKDKLVIPKPVATIEVPDIPPSLVAAGPATISDIGGLGAPTSTGTSKLATGSESSTSTAPAVTGPYLVVEKMPEFVGGMEALMRYLRNHLRYPSAALREQAEGRVYVSFVVRADGTIADISVPKSLGFGLDEEAQRVVSQMPAWTPGRQSNQAVAVRFTLPITFKIQ
ncbi:MAG: energy transducer TonB [Hymenobacter sp.]|nr:MAG: energy transducer TonB [Hymenobacter sp.]